MERTVPGTVSEEIDLYLRTVYSLLRSTTEVQIRTLEEVHAGTNSSLHSNARKIQPDSSAFIYSLLRLPDCMLDVQSVVLGQSETVFKRHGYAQIESWVPVSARARRRRCFFNHKDTLACFIASRSDIDDIIPTLTAYQIEWNKLHRLLQDCSPEFIEQAFSNSSQSFQQLALQLQMPSDDLNRLSTIWGSAAVTCLLQIKYRPAAIRVRLLSGSLNEYRRATRAWWDNLEHTCPAMLDRPVYFISSNTHSIANLLSGFVLQHQDELLKFLHSGSGDSLFAEWQDIQSRKIPSSKENFLYYLLKKYQQTPQGNHLIPEQLESEKKCGITRIFSEHSIDIEAQVIDLSQLNCAALDPRLQLSPGLDCLHRSKAFIINIDYPLGLAAYNILSKVAEHVDPILGVYVMGKAATLNGVTGDIMIPQVVHDEHTRNTYLFQNAFSAQNVAPHLTYGTVLDNQKAVSVMGTFLQNARIMDVIYREGYTDIEMEAGPFLSAIYEMYRPQRHPTNEIINLYGLPFDLGILHYSSDTPLSKGRNLGAGTMSYYGMDSTYASSIAILQRIMGLEANNQERT